jgi:hypothetical protein
MPVEIREDPQRRLRVTTLSGTVTDEELLAAYERLLEGDGYDPAFNDLVDSCAVVRMGATPDGIRRLAQTVARRDESHQGTRMAIVAPGGPAHVMAKLFTFYRDAQGSPVEHRVFRSLPEAREWLGLNSGG